VLTAYFGNAQTLNLTAAGTLKDVPNIKMLTHLTLTGNIDARDVQFMRDSIPNLMELDLAGASVLAYSGTAGTRYGSNYTYPANEMPQYSFYNSSSSIAKTSLLSVKLPAGAMSIGSYAFSNCSGLTGALTIPSSVTAIGSSAFYGCSGLTGALTIPSSVTSIGDAAFYRCSGLTGALTIPSGVTVIGGSAFFGCSGLMGALTIPSGVTTIGSYAFYGCSGLTGALTIPSSVTAIGTSAFAGCSGLTGALTIPSSVTAIEYAAFNDCSGLTGALTIPSSVTSIGDIAFSSCSGLTAINVNAANANYSSADGVLYNKNKTTLIQYPGGKQGEFAIPSSVTAIGNYAFYDCSGLTSLTIPASVTSIGDYAFYSCTGLTAVYNMKPVPQTINTSVFDGVNTGNVYLYVVDNSSVGQYLNASIWQGFKQVLVATLATGISLDKTTASIIAGGTASLTATVAPSNATNKNVTWSSSNPAVATVNNGLVRAVAAGNATITVATVDGSKTAQCVVTVTAAIVYTYTLTFDSQGSSSVAPQTVQQGSRATQPAAPTRPGYTFAGWYNGSARYSFITAVTADLTLTAHWTANSYMLIFGAAGGSVSPAAKTVTFDKAVGDLPTPTRTSYTFNGWNTAKDGSGTVYTSDTVYSIANHTTLYAQWTNGITAVATRHTLSLQIYPNPVVNEELIVNNEELKAGDRIELYSLSGAKLKTFVATGAKSAIDLSALPTGTYVVKAGNRVAKVVKQ
jgi:uncharacterized repeat protein (TIGR02543 family)